VAGLAFAAWTGLAWLISPANSAAYWTSAIFSSNRLGPNAPTANQSLRGILLRAFFPGPPPALLWLGLGLAVAVAGFAAARQSWRLGSAVGGVAITGLLAALLSPVAWVHHYCWIILALGAIAGNGRRHWRVIVALAAGGLFTTALPVFGGYLYFGHVIPALPALVLADAFGLAALALIWVIYCSARSDRSDAERAAPPAPADPDKEEVTPSARILVSRPAPPSG
jgi:alpha-1,2-mannosyltransferase